MLDFLHALITGALVAAVYWGLRSFGLLEGKSLGKRFAIGLPPIFVVVFLLNVIWPA